MEDSKKCTSETVLSSRKRRCQAPLSVTEKIMVQNVFQYVYNEEEKKSDALLGGKPNKSHCARKASEILGIAVATVFKVLKNIKENVTPLPLQLTSPKLKDKLDELTLYTLQHKADDFMCNKESSTIVNESEEMCGHHVDPLSVDPWPVVSVDRNKISKQLLFTTDAASLKSLQEDHNYTLKAKPPEVNAEPSLHNEVSKIDSESQDNTGETETQIKPSNTTNNSKEFTLYQYSKQNSEYERIKWIKEANRRKELQAKVKILQNRIKRSKKKEEQMRMFYRSVRNYTRFSEIDNILNGRFKELCKRVTSNAPKKLDYTPNVIKFTISLYYLSPKAYDFVKKYMDLPHTKILQKYLSRGTYIINLDE